MTVTKTFAAVGNSDEFLIARGSAFTFDIAGSFVGTLELQQQTGGGWRTVQSTVDTVVPLTVVIAPDNLPEDRVRYRCRCTAYTSGSPVFTANDQPSAEGRIRTVERLFNESAGAGVYTASVPVPAGATILDIIVNGVALWDTGTSATMKVGDAANDAGYFTGVNLKATDLLAGESISFDQAGGKAGAYIANSQVSPRYSKDPRVITGIVTTVGSGSAGRTRMVVMYHEPLAAGVPILATKV